MASCCIAAEFSPAGGSESEWVVLSVLGERESGGKEGCRELRGVRWFFIVRGAGEGTIGE